MFGLTGFVDLIIWYVVVVKGLTEVLRLRLSSMSVLW